MKPLLAACQRQRVLQRLDLIGLPYRLGAEPERHRAADCLSLSRHILSTYGIKTPNPERSWYRRLKRRDYSIFYEQLDSWGTLTTDIDVGTVALCQSESGVGLATFIDDFPGWLSFVGTQVVWSPDGVLNIERLYCPGSNNFVNRLE